MQSLSTQLRVGIRALARRPLSSGLAVVTLALALGAVTAVFSLVDATLLRPLPFPEPQRLLALWEGQTGSSEARGRVAPGNFFEWHQNAHGFVQMAAFGSSEAALTGRGDPVVLRGSTATADYLATLGAAPALGRWFTAQEIERGDKVVVLGERVWRERFGASPQVVGSSLTLGDSDYTVVGVLPEGLYPVWPVNGPSLHFDAAHHDYWMPLRLDAASTRRSHVLGVIARLAPGTSLAAARSELDLLAARMRTGAPQNRSLSIVARPLVDEMTASVRSALLLLLAAALVLLAVATANVTGLLAARAVERRQEVAVRLALGARRFELARSFGLEATLIAAAGFGGAVAVARVALALLLRLLPSGVPRLAGATIDLRVLAAGGAVALVVTVGLALAPLALAAAESSAKTLRESSRGTAGSARGLRLRGSLVVAQVALSIALALAAALLLQTYRRLDRMPLGFSPAGVVSAEVSLSRARYDSPGAVARFFQELLDELRADPAVEAAQIAYDQPLESNWSTVFALVGENERPDQPWATQLRLVSPGYFRDLGVRRLAGDGLPATANLDHPGVAVVSRAFARRFFGREDVVGRLIDEGTGVWTWGESMPSRFEVVGVVDDVHTAGLGSSVTPALYLSAFQVPQNEMRVLIRARGGAGPAIAALRDAVRRLDPGQPLGRVTTLERELSNAVAQPRLNLVLILLFAGLSLELALLGIYGVVAQWVASRRREIGIRAALGGAPRQIWILVLARGGRLALAGIVVGTLASLAVGRLISSQLYGVSPTDPSSLAVVVLLVAAATLAACSLPALRAARLDPATTLREE